MQLKYSVFLYNWSPRNYIFQKDKKAHPGQILLTYENLIKLFLNVFWSCFAVLSNFGILSFLVPFAKDWQNGPLREGMVNRNVKRKKNVVNLYNRVEKTTFYLIKYTKILLDSDWLRAVQFMCNNSAKSVTPVQITHRNSGLLAERQYELF